MPIMGDDWRKSPEYQELVQLVLSGDKEDRRSWLDELETDIHEALGEQEKEKAKAAKVLNQLEEDVHNPQSEKWGATYARISRLVEQLSGIDL